MGIGASRAEQELNDLLAKTLVQKEVMEPMAKIGWTHASPPPPDYSGQPAPAEGAPGKDAAPAPGATSGPPAPKPAAAPAPVEPKADSLTVEQVLAMYEALRDDKGLIMGKYETLEQALKGSGHLANMAKDAYRQRDELQKLLDAERAIPRTPAAAAPAAVPQPTRIEAPSREALDKAQANLDAVLSKIAENGGVLDADSVKDLSKANRELAEATVDFKTREADAAQKQRTATENAEWAQVDDYMSKTHPEAARFTEEVALYVQSKPLLAQAIVSLRQQGKRLEATELAWTSFKEVHGAQVSAEKQAKDTETEASLAAREQVRKEKLDEARRDAGVVKGSPGGAGIHTGAGGASSLEEIEAARQAMRREGDAPGSAAARRFRELVIGPSLDPSIFGS